MNNLAHKTLIMCVGPSAIGKSTLMNEVIRQDAEFGRVGGFTTRPPRLDDEVGQYRYLSRSEVEQKIINHQLVQYATSPTTKQIYGTEPMDYSSTYNLKDILANAVSTFRALPFEKTITISLTAPVEQWRSWFLSRYPTPSNEANERLEEAKLSINWSLQDPETYWLSNPANDIALTATKLIDIVRTRPARLQSDEPRIMLERIENGIWT